MSAGTITLTNNSDLVTGVGTTFIADLKSGDMVVAVVGGVTYTLLVKSIESNTKLTIIKAYDGPTSASNAWTAIPRDTMNAITAQLAAETAKALRGLNIDKQNWQRVFSSSGNIDVALPDGSTFNGPSWNNIANSLSGKQDKLNISDVGKSLIAAPNETAARTTIGAAATNEVLKIGNNLADVSNAAETIKNLGIGEWGGVPLSYGETRPWGDVDNSNLNMPAGIYHGVASNWGSPPGSGPAQDLKIINTSSGNWVPQLALVDAPSGGAMWIRSIYNGAYTKWDKLLTASLTGFGTENPTDGPIASNSATLRPGMYYGIGDNVGNPGGITTGGVGVLQFTGDSPTYRCQLAVHDGGGGRLFIRATTSSVWGGWRECYSAGNTTIDANGFIKKASPIVKLFGNGSSELNEESAGVTTERLSEGIYRLSGSLMGFNSDNAWDVEVPADDNKQPLIWVKSTVEANGDIIVKTYHRAHPNAPKFAQNTIDGYSDGDPIDIPAGRWLDLRVQVYSDEPVPLNS